MQNFVKKNKQISARSRWAAACSYVDRRGWRHRHDVTFINVSHCRTDRIDAVTSARDLQIRSKRERERERERELLGRSRCIVVKSPPSLCGWIDWLSALFRKSLIAEEVRQPVADAEFSKNGKGGRIKRQEPSPRRGPEAGDPGWKIGSYRRGSGWLGSRVVSVLDSGAEGPGFKSQPRRYPVTVLSKLFTLIVLLFTKQRNR